MSEICEKARGQMWQILHDHKKEEEWAGVIADLCAIPELAIVDRSAGLPKTPQFYKDWGGESGKDGYILAQQDMLKDGWLKEVKNDGNKG